MALTRKFLSALGIEADKVDEIIESHTDTVNSLKQQRDDYKQQADKVPDLESQLEALKQAGGDGGYKTRYDELKQQFDEYKSEQEAKEATAKVRRAYRELLKNAGISDKRVDAVLKVSDLSGVEIGDDGQIIGADKLTNKIKTEWSDFITTTGASGAETSTPPNNAGANALTKKDILAIKDTAERQAKIAENHELFGF